MMHPVPRPLLDELNELVVSLRPRRFQAFRVGPLARRLGVEVEWRNLGNHLLGLTLDDRRVLLNRGRLRGSAASFTFAHELAHVLEARGSFRTIPRSRREWFADWFARELLVPHHWLSRATRDELAWLASRRWVGAEIVALQASVCGLVPPVFQRSGVVFCRRCGSRHALSDCGCTGLRRSLSDPALPELEEVLERMVAPQAGEPRALALAV